VCDGRLRQGNASDLRKIMGRHRVSASFRGLLLFLQRVILNINFKTQ
jgi:hypothetical protein